MKKVFLALIGLGLCVQVRSEALSTTDGTTYNNITTRRVDPDGLYIEYKTAGGGVGMSKVKFSRLSAEQQKQFGFDATKAKAYETQVAKANEDYGQESLRQEQAARVRRTELQARATEDQRVENDRLLAAARLRTAEAELARANTQQSSGGGGYYSYDGGWGGGIVGIPHAGKVPPARRDYAPIVTPIPFPSRNITRSK